MSIQKLIKSACLTGVLAGFAATVSAENDRWQHATPAAEAKWKRAETQARSLASQMTLEEKVMQMVDTSAPVERLGLKQYCWWNEALHGVAFTGLATVFPEPIGMAASFNPLLVNKVFSAVSDEMRAKHEKADSRGLRNRYQGLNAWTPNINIFRDPRWGRGIETYGEDPYLTSVMGLEVIRGLQGPDDAPYDKLHACAKHYAVHSGPEAKRHQMNMENLNPRYLWETYLPAFKTAVVDGHVREVMCAYNSIDGEPCCSNRRYLNHILRGEWGFKGLVVTDCNAISDLYNDKAHGVYKDAQAASAAAVIGGTDVECGNKFKTLTEAVKAGQITERQITESVVRLLTARILMGDLAPKSEVEWTRIPYSVVGGKANHETALEMARQSMTLLYNKGNALPLKAGDGLTVAVVGPNAADSMMLWGNYNGAPPYTITILDGIRRQLRPGDSLIYDPGCSWVEETVLESAFDDCKADGRTGFRASYWNNIDRSGQPDVNTFVPTPFRFCTLGAHVFAPNVNLTGFSAAYESQFTPKQSGTVYFDFYSCGNGRMFVDGKQVTQWKNLRSRFRHFKMEMKQGQTYNLRIEYEYTIGDAELRFDIGFKNAVDIDRTVARVKDADVVVFVGGISSEYEGEQSSVSLPGFNHGDRTNIQLPDVQRRLMKAIRRAGKRIVMVNCSGSSIALGPEQKLCDAILQAWYPGQAGGQAVAEVLFGQYNPGGKLPVTFYKDESQLPDYEDYDMAGRTYRYLKSRPLYPFGYGLSYTTFRQSRPKATLRADGGVDVALTLTNTGKTDGDEVVQVYLHKDDDTADAPAKTLRAFRRVHLRRGESRTVTLTLTGSQLEWWNPSTNTMCRVPGRYTLLVGNSSDSKDLRKVGIDL